MSKLLTAVLVSSFMVGTGSAALAQQSTTSSPSSVPNEAQKGDKMKAGEMGGGSGNTGVPGTSPAAEGNKNQDSRTTKTRDR